MLNILPKDTELMANVRVKPGTSWHTMHLGHYLLSTFMKAYATRKQ